MQGRRLFGNWFALGALAALVVGACSGGSSSHDADCTPGNEGCACDGQAHCAAGLSCLSNLCVDPGTGGGGRSQSSGGLGSDVEAGRDAGERGGSDSQNGGKSSQNGGKGSQSGGKGSQGGAPGGGAPENGGVGPDAEPTPVSEHGQLAVSGSDLLDEHAARVKLEGMSSMWLNWDDAGYAQSLEGLRWMRDNWNLRVFRAAMGVEPDGAYLDDPEGAKRKLNQIVENAVRAGVYVIIDWHDHAALSHRAQAEAFFSEMSARWGSYPNVIYEVFNEPLDLDWTSELKPYHQAIVNVIRKNDPDNVIVLGTPNWDQDVDVAALSPLSGKNLVYSLHFYACSHRATQRDKAKLARSRGLPLFVSEWGATHADGGLDGLVCESEAQLWHNWLDANSISWTAWKLDGCTDTSCMFKDRTASPDGGWKASELNGHAPFVISQMKNDSGSGGASSGGSTSSSGGNSSGGNSSGGAGSTDPFPPTTAGCALITSCTSCCSSTGVFALDAYSEDATKSLVTSFEASASVASAEFTFDDSEEVGAIFFKLASPQTITSLGLSATVSGGSLEVALVRSSGADGCIYPVSEGELSSLPWHCWGLGAGPYADLPVEQIEVRVRSLMSGRGRLAVSELVYGP